MGRKKEDIVGESGGLASDYLFQIPALSVTALWPCNLSSPHLSFSFGKVKVLVAQLCPTLWDPMDCSPPGSSVLGILQARILEWVAIPFFRGSSRPRDQARVFCIVGGFFTIWATLEALVCVNIFFNVNKYIAEKWMHFTHSPPKISSNRSNEGRTVKALIYWPKDPGPKLS